jgi:hypothetical protein
MAHDHSFQVPFHLTEGEAHIFAAAMRFTAGKAPLRSESVKALEKRLDKFIAEHWSCDKISASPPPRK